VEGERYGRVWPSDSVAPDVRKAWRDLLEIGPTSALGEMGLDAAELLRRTRVESLEDGTLTVSVHRPDLLSKLGWKMADQVPEKEIALGELIDGHLRELLPGRFRELELVAGEEDLRDISPYGVFNMAGNLSEWVQTSDPEIPVKFIMGGSFQGDYLDARTWPRTQFPRTYRLHFVGFRVVREVEE
jgi:hypothetical protein